MPKVFVIQEQIDKDLSPAKVFGDLHVILGSRDKIRGLDWCLQKLQRALSQIKPEDHVMLVGDSTLIGMGCHVAMHFSEGGPLSILHWDRTTYQYIQEIVHI